MPQKAVKVAQGPSASIVNDSPIPELKDDFVLAETRAVALNPADQKHLSSAFGDKLGSTLGHDWSGVILEVGRNVTKFKPGDEAFGFCHGGHSDKLEAGAFAQKIVCKEDATYKKPAYMSFQEAASLAVGLTTVGQMMYEIGGLPEPSLENAQKKSSRDVLIYGGSTSTGSLAAQLARLSGRRVLATASPSSFEFLHARGIDHVFDYHDPNSISAIKSLTNDNLDYIVDCIGSEPAAKFCAQVLSSKGGHYHNILYPLPPHFKQLRPEDSCKATAALGYTMLGEPFKFRSGGELGVDQNEMEFARRWHAIVEKLLASKAVIPHPLDVRHDGLNSVVEALTEMGSTGGPRGKKIVCLLG